MPRTTTLGDRWTNSSFRDDAGTTALVACHLVFAVSWIGLISSPRSGSPQPANTTARTEFPQLHHRGEIGSGGLNGIVNGDTDRTPSWEPLLATQHRSCSTHDPRHHRQLRLRRNPEGTEIETRKPRPTRKGTLRKEHQQAPLSCDAGDTIEVGKAVGQLEAFEKQNPQAPQQGAGKNLIRELLLDDIDGLTGQNSGHNDGVHVACVIEGHHRAATRNSIDTGHRYRDSNCRECRACKCADRHPSPGQAWQRHHGKPTKQEKDSDEGPPPCGVENLADRCQAPAICERQAPRSPDAPTATRARAAAPPGSFRGRGPLPQLA